jgi:hypothetical protein
VQHTLIKRLCSNKAIALLAIGTWHCPRRQAAGLLCGAADTHRTDIRTAVVKLFVHPLYYYSYSRRTHIRTPAVQHVSIRTPVRIFVHPPYEYAYGRRKNYSYTHCTTIRTAGVRIFVRFVHPPYEYSYTHHTNIRTAVVKLFVHPLYYVSYSRRTNIRTPAVQHVKSSIVILCVRKVR